MLVTVLILLGTIGLQAQSECRTPLGVPCYTAEIRMGDWELFGNGWTVVKPYAYYQREVVRGDGSTAQVTLDEKGQALEGRVRRADGQILRIRHSIKTVEQRPARTSKESPHRRSEPGDLRCASSLLYYGLSEQFTYQGTSRVAGIAVVRYRKNGSWLTTFQEVSLAPELDCLVMRFHDLRVPLPLFRPGLFADFEVTAVQLGAPSADLFTIPAGYTVSREP